MSSRFLLFLSLMLLPLWLVDDAAAAVRERTVVKQEFQATFDRMMANPADVETTLHYSELAVELGDYESAIPPLERILMMKPDLPKIQLQVGILYYLLHSNDMAKHYLLAAKEGKNVPADVVARADNYLNKI